MVNFNPSPHRYFVFLSASGRPIAVAMCAATDSAYATHLARMGWNEIDYQAYQEAREVQT